MNHNRIWILLCILLIAGVYLIPKFLTLPHEEELRNLVNINSIQLDYFDGTVITMAEPVKISAKIEKYTGSWGDVRLQGEDKETGQQIQIQPGPCSDWVNDCIRIIDRTTQKIFFIVPFGIVGARPYLDFVGLFFLTDTGPLQFVNAVQIKKSSTDDGYLVKIAEAPEDNIFETVYRHNNYELQKVEEFTPNYFRYADGILLIVDNKESSL
jgi:hypothetical protein